MDTSPARHLAYLPLDGIPRAVRNPKEHDSGAIRGSVEKFGCTIAGILDERTGRLVAGHGRLGVLEEMRDEGADPPEGVQRGDDGAWLVPILRGWASRSDREAEAYVVADNRLNEMGGWDHRMLAEVLDELADTDPSLMAITGYTDTDLADMLASFGDPPDLDALGNDYGEPGEGDLWPILRFKVPPGIRNDFYELTSALEDDTDRFIALVNRAKAAQS